MFKNLDKSYGIEKSCQEFIAKEIEMCDMNWIQIKTENHKEYEGNSITYLAIK